MADELGETMDTPSGRLPNIQMTTLGDTPAAAALADLPVSPLGRLFTATGNEGSAVCSVCQEEAYQPDQADPYALLSCLPPALPGTVG